jgi:hypothetical protein
MIRHIFTKPTGGYNQSEDIGLTNFIMHKSII